MTVLAQLNDLFRVVFDDPELIVSPQTTANDVEGWDSLSHANLISAIELRFRISFSRKEILTFRDVGEMGAAIEAKTGTAAGQP